MPIGSPHNCIARLVTVDVFLMISIGGCAGLALGFGAARYVESLFYQVKATDAEIMAIITSTHNRRGEKIGQNYASVQGWQVESTASVCAGMLRGNCVTRGLRSHFHLRQVQAEEEGVHNGLL